MNSVVPQIATRHILEDEIKVKTILKGINHVDHVRMLERFQQVTLVEYWFDAVLRDYPE